MNLFSVGSELIEGQICNVSVASAAQQQHVGRGHFGQHLLVVEAPPQVRVSLAHVTHVVARIRRAALVRDHGMQLVAAGEVRRQARTQRMRGCGGR